MNIELISTKKWYQDRVSAVVTIRRQRNLRVLRRLLNQGTLREHLHLESGLPERYIRMLLGEPALPEAEV